MEAERPDSDLQRQIDELVARFAANGERFRGLEDRADASEMRAEAADRRADGEQDRTDALEARANAANHRADAAQHPVELGRRSCPTVSPVGVYRDTRALRSCGVAGHASEVTSHG